MPTLTDLWLARQTRDELGRVTLLVPLFTFFFFVVVLYSGLDFRVTYVLLIAVGAVLVLWYAVQQLARGNRVKALQAVDIPNFTLMRAIVPILLGVLVVFTPFVVYLILTGQGITARSPLSNGALFVDNVLLVAVTEEFFFRWVMPQFYGGILPAILFGVSHPSVRDALLSNPATAIYPFMYFFTFGLIFQQLVFMGSATTIPLRWRSLLGIPFVMGLHGAYNTIATLFPGTVIAGQEITSFAVVPTVLVVAVLVVVLYAVRNIRRPSMRQSADPSRSRICAQLPLIPVGIDNRRVIP